MLKEDIAQRADPQTDNRNLCLLVVYNSPLIMAWAETMNNGKFIASHSPIDDFGRTEKD